MTSIWRREFYATRTSAHLAFAMIVWPCLTVVGTVVALMDLPYFPVSFRHAFLGGVIGTLMSVPDMAFVGALVFGLSGLIFRRFGPDTRGRTLGYLRLCLEPLLMTIAVIGGASLWYPAILSAPLLSPFANMPVALLITLMLTTVVVGACFASSPGKRRGLAVALVAAGALSPLPMQARTALTRFTGHAPTAVLLGIDSISHTDDVGRLRGWVNEKDGTWYQHAVAPGLLTNAVWSSILTMKPIRTHGVFLTFLGLPPGTQPLLEAARANGYRTISAFSDQLTCAVGSRAGFDVDRSGPIGWRQLLLPIVANNSFLLPVIRPALPDVWLLALPPNQPGTVTYDVRREVRGILRAGSRTQKTLVMAHLTYTHVPAYPGTAALSWAERWSVARAPAKAIFDRSFDWKDVDRESDPIPLHRWKLAHLQDTIVSEMDSARFLERGGRLIVFSDHGDRADLTLDTFTDRRYHHVLLASFGLPPRCPEAPISLADIGVLLELTEVHTEPAVEFMYTPETLVANLTKSASLRWSGDVDIDRRILPSLFKELRRHDPWPALVVGSCIDKRSSVVAVGR